MELRDLKVGMYFRTKAGTINKIDSLTDDKSEFYFDTKPIFSDGECLGSKWSYTKDIIKASDKLIDLIEVGDYVNGMKVVAIDSDGRLYVPEDLGQPYDREFSNGFFYHTLLDMNTFKIKSILTKESFEQMSYKVGE